MSITKIANDLQGQRKKFPPVNEWNPELCEGQEFFINREGDWFYNDSPIKNNKLVNLFSTVLRKDFEDYYLVTPVEKVLVKVDLAPYKIVDFKINNKSIILETNLNYDFELNDVNTTKLIKENNTSIPIVNVRNNIEGFFNRNTYYKLVDWALERNFIENNFLFLPSNNLNHIIGKIA
tara:strand:- start:3538 stop:4071 length:534 start_codon:yes stop_codon:yes gene_type:complete